MIKVTNLNKYYNKGRANELHVINNTTLTFDDTGLVCILGESGSGKTTLMNTISGLDNFADGNIDVDGTVITKFGSAEQEHVRNEKFGYIFQNYYLLQDRTVEYNIKLSLSLYDISDEEKDNRIDYVLKAVEMSRYKKRPVSQLSGGQQQRIAIARALAKTPRVIFADEPTGNLDEANTLRIMGILKKLSKECLVVVVTHERSIADFFADRIIWISDGKIEQESAKSTQGVYEYVDNTNIYLQEFEKKEYDNGSVKIETYQSGEGDMDLTIELKIIYENGKVYLYSENDENIEYITGNNEKKVIDAKRPKMEMDDIDSLEYSLDRIESSKKPKMSFKELFTLAVSNLKSMGKKQIFLIVSLAAMAVLMVLTLQDIMSALSIDKQKVLKSDSHYIQVRVEKNSLIKNDKYKQKYLEALEDLKQENLTDNLYLLPTAVARYQYEGFWQLEDVESSMSDFTFVPIDLINEGDLLYGTMPENQYEIVVDRWVLENFIGGGNEFSNVITDIRHFLGKTIIMSSSSKETEVTISGISDTKEPSIYIDRTTGMCLSSWSNSFATISELKQADTSGRYTDVELGEGDVLISTSNYENELNRFFGNKYGSLYKYYKEGFVNELWWMTYEEWIEKQYDEYGITLEELDRIVTQKEGVEIQYYAKSGAQYNAVGSFNVEDMPNVDMIVADNFYDSMLTDLIVYRKEFVIYTDDKESVKNYFEDVLNKKYKNNIIFNVVDLYAKEMKSYEAAREIKVNGRMLVTFTVFIISLIILYFMMKANAIKRMQDIGVYRLIGISKRSIVGMFAIENILITTYTSLIGAVGAISVMKFIAGIPALNTTVVYPWYVFLGTVAFFYIINTLVGILPIRKILRLPPAQLAAKYDI